MYCKHKWEILFQTTTESGYQHTIRVMQEAGISGSQTIPWQMCGTERKSIQILTCQLCGKVKKFVENI